MSGLEKALFNLKVSLYTNYPMSEHGMIEIQFTAKSLNKQSAKAGKEEITEKARLKKVRKWHVPKCAND